MISMSLWNWLVGRRKSLWLKADHYLLPQKHFENALRRERLRADRNSTRFSLLTLTFGRRDGATIFDAAAEVLESRIRATDLPGWHKDRTMGIVLPDTEAEGAWKLADDLRQLMEAKGISPRFSVYAYPTFSGNDEDGTAGQQEQSSGDREREPATAQPLEVLLIQACPAWKRSLDILGASVGLILLGPLMILAAIAIKVTSRGPIIFKQQRDTIGGRPFQIYKFRTMSVDAEARLASLLALNEQDGAAFKMAKDPRVTSVGRFLRSTSIDELPQLLNVLFGDMTLVGPRALQTPESNSCEPWQRRRLDVRAGITCIWQVRGRSAVSFTQRMRMDLGYVQSRSLRTDLSLLAETIPAVLARRGAY
jgi:lipopolysaccharide/colanic/teichoic acid biosynthesis glycosyltransferase